SEFHGNRPLPSEATTMPAGCRPALARNWPACLLALTCGAAASGAGDAPRPGAGPLRLEHKAEVFSLAFAPDGRPLVAAGPGALHFWAPATGRLRLRTDRYPGTIYALAFAPDGKALAVGHYKDYQTYEGVITLLDPATGRELLRLGGHREAVRGVA